MAARPVAASGGTSSTSFAALFAVKPMLELVPRLQAVVTRALLLPVEPTLGAARRLAARPGAGLAVKPVVVTAPKGVDASLVALAVKPELAVRLELAVRSAADLAADLTADSGVRPLAV